MSPGTHWSAKMTFWCSESHDGRFAFSGEMLDKMEPVTHEQVWSRRRMFSTLHLPLPSNANLEGNSKSNKSSLSEVRFPSRMCVVQCSSRGSWTSNCFSRNFAFVLARPVQFYRISERFFDEPLLVIFNYHNKVGSDFYGGFLHKFSRIFSRLLSSAAAFGKVTRRNNLCPL